MKGLSSSKGPLMSKSSFRFIWQCDTEHLEKPTHPSSQQSNLGRAAFKPFQLIGLHFI